MLINGKEMSEAEFNQPDLAPDPAMAGQISTDAMDFAYAEIHSTEPVVTPEAEPGTSETTEPESTEATGETKRGADAEPQTTKTMEERLAALEKQNAALHRRIDRMVKKPGFVKPDPIDESTAPKEEDFDTYSDYEKAKDQFDVDRKINTEIIRAAEKAEKEASSSDAATWQEETGKEGIAKYGDFIEVVANDKTLPITLDILSILQDIDEPEALVRPADILYYLGKNKAETIAISKMNRTQATLAIKGVEAKIADAMKTAGIEKPPKADAEKQKAKTVTTAPEPATPPDTVIVVQKDPDKMTQAEYEAWRRNGGGR